jgi:hypothetical protein
MGQAFGASERIRRYKRIPLYRGMRHRSNGRAVEAQHGGAATLAQSVPVRETFKGSTVHVFDLEGHQTPAVLHMGAIKSPVDAVRAAIVAEHRRE